MDLRPFRTDNKEMRVSYREKEYDRDATAKLVLLMWQTGMVTKVYFNDAKIARVAPMIGHDDHLHVEVRA